MSQSGLEIPGHEILQLCAVQPKAEAGCAQLLTLSMLLIVTAHLLSM